MPHFVRQATTPTIYEFTSAAIDRGGPARLRYLPDAISNVYAYSGARLVPIRSMTEEQWFEATPATRRDVIRAKTFALGSQLLRANQYQAGQTSRDEYPYACTMDGGAEAFWCHVPIAEQQSQGGSLAAVVRNLSIGDYFDVVLVP